MVFLMSNFVISNFPNPLFHILNVVKWIKNINVVDGS